MKRSTIIMTVLWVLEWLLFVLIIIATTTTTTTSSTKGGIVNTYCSGCQAQVQAFVVVVVPVRSSLSWSSPSLFIGTQLEQPSLGWRKFPTVATAAEANGFYDGASSSPPSLSSSTSSSSSSTSINVTTSTTLPSSSSSSQRQSPKKRQQQQQQYEMFNVADRLSSLLHKPQSQPQVIWDVYVDQSKASLDRGGRATLDAFWVLASSTPSTSSSLVRVHPAIFAKTVKNKGPVVRCISSTTTTATTKNDKNGLPRPSFEVTNVDTVDKVYRILTHHMAIQDMNVQVCECLKWKYLANSHLDAGRIPLAIECYDKALNATQYFGTSTTTTTSNHNNNNNPNAIVDRNPFMTTSIGSAADATTTTDSGAPALGGATTASARTNNKPPPMAAFTTKARTAATTLTSNTNHYQAAAATSTRTQYQQEGTLLLLRAMAYLQRAKEHQVQLQKCVQEFINDNNINNNINNNNILDSSMPDPQHQHQTMQPMLEQLWLLLNSTSSTTGSSNTHNIAATMTSTSHDFTTTNIAAPIMNGSSSSASFNSSTTTASSFASAAAAATTTTSKVATSTTSAATAAAIGPAMFRRMESEARHSERLVRRTQYRRGLYQFALLHAARDALRATQLLPNSALAWHRAAETLASLWVLSDAITYYERAQELLLLDQQQQQQMKQQQPRADQPAAPSKNQQQHQQQQQQQYYEWMMMSNGDSSSSLRIQDISKMIAELKRREMVTKNARERGCPEDILQLVQDVWWE